MGQWDTTKCKWGHPEGFSDEEAAKALNSADFTNSVYVNTSAEEGLTRQAYAYYQFNGYRICVVGHIHIKEGEKPAPGNSFIPGWKNWYLATPLKVVKAIAALKDSGTFPGDGRYPHKLN